MDIKRISLTTIFLVFFLVAGCATKKDFSLLQERQKKDTSLLQARLDRVEKFLQSDGKYDKNFLLDNENFVAAKKSVVYLYSEAVFENLETPEADGIIQKGIGTGVVIKLPFGPVDRKYVLTAGHVVFIDKAVQLSRTPFGIMEIIFDKKKSQSIFILQEGKEKVELKVLMREGEVALLELPSSVADIPALPYPFGKNEQLEVGDAVYVLGYPLGSANVSVRKGFVSDKQSLYYPDYEFLNEASRAVKKKFPPEDFFMIKGGIVSGDSGGPILAIRNGKRELVGLASAVARGGSQLLDFCYILHSDKILSEIKRFFENSFENSDEQ